MIEWARPTNVAEIRSFLVLVGYYRRFTKDVLRIVFALTNLLKKATKFEWTKKCERAFQELRQRLTTVLILALPIEGKEYTIYGDASKNGLGCVLMQEDTVVTYAF